MRDANSLSAQDRKKVMDPLSNDEKWITVKETAHKELLILLLFIGFINGSAFGFIITYLILERRYN